MKSSDDNIQNLMVQVNKALDNDGQITIRFRNGENIVVSKNILQIFRKKYMELKPYEKEKMQNLAAQSKDHFTQIADTFVGNKVTESIYL